MSASRVSAFGLGGTVVPAEGAGGHARLHRRLWGEARVPGGRLPLLALVILVTAGATIGQMLALARVIAEVFLAGASLDAVMPWMVALAAITVVRAALAWAGETLAQRGAARVKADLRDRLFRQVLRLGPAWSRTEASGEWVATAVEGVEKLDDYFARYLPARLGVGLAPGVVGICVLATDWPSGVLLALTGPLIPVFMVLIGRGAEQATRHRWEALQRMGAHFLDVLQGLTTLKLHGRSRAQADVLRTVSDRYRRSTMAVLRVAFLSGLVLELAASLSTALVAVTVGVRLVEGYLDFETGLFVLLLAPEFYLPFRALGARHHAGMEGVVAADRIYGLLDAVPLVENVHRGLAPAGGPVEIRLEQLSYRYPGTDKPALEAVSTVIAPGRVTALAGPSGSGKSTLVNLLLGFLTYREGAVLMSGVPLRELDPRRHLARVAWVPQHPHLFNGTVFENLRLARPEATEAALTAALERAGADRFVRRLPQGGHTLLGNNGCRLSGGERQRLAVARAFLKDAPLLILDEPVAALDPESEAFLQQSLEQLAADRTVVVIAHRTATLRRADRVLLLDRGRLVAEGVHEDLRRDSELYAAMTAPSAEVLA